MNDKQLSSAVPQALMSSAAYPHPTEDIRLVETHLSWVFLTGEFVYKVKKPLSYSFVDFSTLALREHFCAEELRLNRRFNTEIYLDVIPIVADEDIGLRIGDPKESDLAMDWAVKMRQFDPSAQADVLLSRQQLHVDELHTFGMHLAEQHDALPVVSGDYEPIAPMLANFDSLKQVDAVSIHADKIVANEQYTRSLITDFRELLMQRHRTGHVRECHGDLHLSNIVRLDAGLSAFDCLEFSEELRNIDTANDIAFLFMDCLVKQRPDLAYTFIDGYLDTSGDYAGAELLPLFSIYRSMVRAKVAALRLEQVPDDTVSAEKLAAHIDWACEQSKREAGHLILMHGYSGAGKSFWAKQLVPRVNAIRIRSDVLRKTQAGMSPQQRSDLAVGEAMYSTDSSESVYRNMAKHAARLLSGGENVVIDATCLRAAQRALFYRVAEDASAACTVVALTASQQVLEQRIRQRSADGADPSDADTTVLAWQQQNADPLTDAEPVIRFDTENDSLTMLLAELKVAAARD